RRRYCLLRREETRRSLPGFSRARRLRIGIDLRPFAPQQAAPMLVHYSLITAEYSLIWGSVFPDICPPNRKTATAERAKLRDCCGNRRRFFRIFSEFSLILDCKGSETGTLATASATIIYHR